MSSDLGQNVTSMRVINLANLQQFTAVNLTSDPGFDPDAKTVPNCMEVRWDYQLPNGVLAHCVTHARYAPPYPGTIAKANSLLTALAGLYSAHLTLFMPNSAALTAVSLRDINAADQPYISSNTGGALGANNTDPNLPDEVAVVLTLRTAFTGPGNRGRIYLPAWAANASGPGGVIAPLANDALDAFAAGLMGVYTSNSVFLTLGLRHRLAYTGSTGSSHPERQAHTQDVTSVVRRDNHWDTQRRRGLR